MKNYTFSGEEYNYAVAIVGMAGTFNDAPDINELWDNLARGHEAVRFLSEEELRVNGCPLEMLGHPKFVPASAMMQEVESFDSEFFGFTPAETRMMDPQLRLMLQTAWHAFENANIVPGNDEGLTGVFAGAHPSSYLVCALGPEFLIHKGMETLSASIVNGQDFLSTWLSYKLGLNGPSLNVQTACSTGLVAVTTACQNLLDYSCDTALAIAGAVFYPRNWGYLSETGSIFSHDGHCKPFDASSSGTIGGEGVGAVVLKRLPDALEAKDPILGVIRGHAVNNDGSNRAGYTTPSVAGQRKLLEQAMASAGLQSSSISYVEAHGTGTQLGDSVEFTALDAVFGRQRKESCYLGAIKANLGHLGACAGMVGLFKVLLMFEHGKIPPQINYSTPNPEIHLSEGGFQISTELRDWDTEEPRIAGVSSFGLGGTNCHMIVEEPGAKESFSVGGNGLGEALPLCLSAKSKEALKRLCLDWSDFLNSSQDASIWHLATSTLDGRASFPWRTVVPAPAKDEAAKHLASVSEQQFVHCDNMPISLAVIIGDEAELDAGEISVLANQVPAFAVCAESLLNHCGLDIFNLENDASHKHALTVAVGLGLTNVLRHAGIQPDMVVGTGAGEQAATAAMGNLDPDTALTQDKRDAVPISVAEAQLRQIIQKCLQNGIEKFIVIGRYTGAGTLSMLTTDDAPRAWLPLISRVANGNNSIVVRLSQGLAGLFTTGVTFAQERLHHPLQTPLYAFEKKLYRPGRNMSPWANSPIAQACKTCAVQTPCTPNCDPTVGVPEGRMNDTLGAADDEQDIEAVMASIWAGALGISHINPDDNFFEKGGTSLSAIKIIAEMEKYTGITLQLKDILTLGTLRRVLNKLADEAAREA